MKNLYCDINTRKKIVRLHHLNSLFQTCNRTIVNHIYIYKRNAWGELKRTLELIIKNALVFIKAILNEASSHLRSVFLQRSHLKGESLRASFFVCLFFHKQLIIKERSGNKEANWRFDIPSESPLLNISYRDLRSHEVRAAYLLAQRPRPRRISQ